MGPIGGAPLGNVPASSATPIGPVRVPGAMSPAQRRRRDVLVLMLGIVAIMFLMGIMSGSMVVWVLQVLADVLLGAYVWMLLRLKARNASRRPQPQVEPQRPLMAPVSSSLPNVHDLTARRFPAATAPIDAHRGAKVLALRRSASW
jgi:hypothetical protein